MRTIAKSIVLLAVMLAGLESNAQNEQDVLRYGQTPLMGSGRYIGMGGAFNALGGDVSALSSNPAGAAVFLSNEFIIGLGLNLNSSTGTYFGRSTGNIEPKIIVPTFGIISNQNIKDSKWKSVNFGYTYNRIADFTGKTSLRSKDNKSSLAEGFAEAANGNRYDSLDLFNTNLAWETYLIDTVAGNPYMYKTTLNSSEKDKSYITTTRGKMGDNLFVVGANYDNKFYIGAGFSVIGISFSASEVNRERVSAPDSIDNFVYQSSYNADATGYNAKIGAIYRVADNLRVGANVQTPTTIRVIEEFYSSINTDFTSGEDVYFESPIGQNNYNIVIPARIGFGVSYLFGKKGLVSFDFNHMDYSKAKFKNQLYSSVPTEEQINFDDINTNVLARYLGPSSQIKMGGEYKINNLTLRAGYGWAENGIKRDQRIDETDVSTISLGAGITIENMSIDFGFANSQYSRSVFYYSDVAKVKYGMNTASLTVLFRY